MRTSTRLHGETAIVKTHTFPPSTSFCIKNHFGSKQLQHIHAVPYVKKKNPSQTSANNENQRQDAQVNSG